MIDIKITMIGGREFKIRNYFANNVNDFIRNIFTPQGVMLKFCNIVDNVWIQVENVVSVEPYDASEEEEQLGKEVVEKELGDKGLEVEDEDIETSE